MITSQRIAGGVLVLIGAVALWEGLRFPFGTLWRPGPAYVPAVLSLVLIAIGVVLIVRHGGTRILDMPWRESRHALAILTVCAFIALTLERLGWRLAVAGALLVLLGLLEHQGVVITVVLAIAIAFGSFYLFNDVLKVPLPRGAFGF